jgi:hypothetical protein
LRTILDVAFADHMKNHSPRGTSATKLKKEKRCSPWLKTERRWFACAHCYWQHFSRPCLAADPAYKEQLTRMRKALLYWIADNDKGQYPRSAAAMQEITHRFQADWLKSPEFLRNNMKNLVALLAIAMPAVAQEPYSPYVERDYPANVYWGDTHVHTFLSADAYGLGTRTTPDEAYRFARGETIRATGGDEVRIRRPLDFLLVADHAENMGVLPALARGDPRLLASEKGQELAELRADLSARPALRDVLRAKTLDEYNAGSSALGKEGGNYGINDEFKREIWQSIVAVAERHNSPGKFTTFAGYEYSSSSLHRNVLFAGDPTETLKTLPYSQWDSPNPEDLWDYLEAYREMTGSDVISIPHNSNLSRGNMFMSVTYEGKPISPDYARIRSSIEPIIEVTQIKGDSETHPLNSPDDEFADYEPFDIPLRWTVPVEAAYRLYRAVTSVLESRSEEELTRASYARSALQTGLDIEAKVGVNPYRFGMIGSTDAHTGLATVDEDNFWGKMGVSEPNPYRASTQGYYSSSGYAAVWAEENTREAIFAAMKRREVYATTGPRITLRFFAGWDFTPDHAQQPDIAQVGYSLGVPMGGDLIQSAENKAPTFLVRATKDPDGANLDRVQIIKGWRDGNGELQEKVYDVAFSANGKSGNRTLDGNGVLPSVGSTVELADARYLNNIGSAQLSTTWTDPDFNETESAVYYVRVLQIPTPRWTVYDAKFYQQELPQDSLLVIEERAYSSPIWYTP